MTALARHWRSARAALASERERARALVRTDETSFLPPALEIVERPVSPTARMVTWLALVGLFLVILWMSLGRIDIVASANGRIIPGDEVKIIQSAQPGIVRAIFVTDNQPVKAGQPLIELDPTMVGAETEQAREALRTAQLDATRDAAVLAALDGRPLELVPPPGTSPDVVAAQTALARDTLDNIREAAAGRSADHRSSMEAHAEALQQVAKIDQTLPLLDTEIGVYEELLRKGFVAKMKVLEMRRQRLAMGKDRDIALATARKAAAEMDAAGHAQGQSRADARSRLLADLVRARSEAQLRSEELTKAAERSRLQRILSPVDGTVTQLAAHTIGGVVEVARPLMVIVPSHGRLKAEVQVLNRDVGFVRAGQPVILKLAAFPFTRFGTVEGRVESIAGNAVMDRRLGWVFPARIALDRPRIEGSGETHQLIPGMETTADIRTGRRTLLSYLVSPIEATIRQAGKER